MGYKAVIIDDNPNTVASLRMGIDWDRIGLEAAGAAYDGPEGLELIRRIRPDIVITDIMMPGMDGLSMVEAALEEVPECKVIVITGYGDIRYATRAIRLSVFDYILKPVEDAELERSLEKAAAILRGADHPDRRRKEIRRGKMTAALLGGQQMTVSQIIGEPGPAMCAMLVAAREEGFSRLLTDRMEEAPMLRENECVTAEVEEKLVILCAGDGPEAEWERKIAETEAYLEGCAGEILVGRSGIYSGGVSMRRIYLEAREDLERRHGPESGRDGGETHRHVSVAEMQEEAVRLAQAAEGSGEYEEIRRSVAEYTLGSPGSLQIMTVMFCSRVIQTHRAWAEELEPFFYEVPRNQTAAQFEEWLKRFLAAMDRIREERGGKSETVWQAIQYMKKHVMENIRLEQVAEMLYVSPNYLSTLIRKETGSTFQQHILQMKMELSKQMLTESRMSVDEIAHTVGYRNYASFYQVFKRMEKVTPTEYRFRKKG